MGRGDEEERNKRRKEISNILVHSIVWTLTAVTTCEIDDGDPE